MNADISGRQMEIIEAAGKILTASGVGGLTIKNLAKEMRFSESAIYRHFTSKEEIIVAMLNYLAETMEERLAQAAHTPVEPEEKLKALLQSQLVFFKQNPHFVVAVFSDGLLEESGAINEAILRIMRAKMKHLLSIIAEGREKGVFTQAIAEEDLLHIVMGAFRLLMFKWRLSHFAFDLPKEGERLIKSILAIIKK